jgi:hypothetical protein
MVQTAKATAAVTGESAMSDQVDTFPTMNRAARAQLLRADERELQAQIVHALNLITTCNERMRAALIDGNLALIQMLANMTVDQGVTLMTLVVDRG